MPTPATTAATVARAATSLVLRTSPGRAAPVLLEDEATPVLPAVLMPEGRAFALKEDPHFDCTAEVTVLLPSVVPETFVAILDASYVIASPQSVQYTDDGIDSIKVVYWLPVMSFSISLKLIVVPVVFCTSLSSSVTQ